MDNNFIKGIECVNCQAQFTWQSLPKADKLALTTCICPKCRTTLKQVFPIAQVLSLLIVAVLYLSLLLWAIPNTSENTVLGIAVMGLVIGHFTKKLMFIGYIRTKKVDK